MTRALVLAHYSVRHARFDERVQAAAAAGFDGIGLNSRVYAEHLADGWTVDRMRSTLDAAGIQLLEVEALPLFGNDREATVFELVEAFRPHHVQAIAPFTDSIDVAAAGESLAATCERLAPFGCQVAFEFLPFTGIRDVEQAIALFAAAGYPANAGLCVDAWHVFRGAGLGQLAELDPALVSVVQFDDGPRLPVLDDYLQDTLHHRCLPGDGEFDLVAFLRALPADVPLSVEVIDDDLDALPVDVAVARIGEATRKLLAAAA